MYTASQIFLSLSGLPSNGIPEFLPYVVSIVGLAVLLLSLCVIFIISTWLRTKKNKSKGDLKPESYDNEPKLEDNIVYEEIDELQQNCQTVNISKNMAYCQFQQTDPQPLLNISENMAYCPFHDAKSLGLQININAKTQHGGKSD